MEQVLAVLVVLTAAVLVVVLLLPWLGARQASGGLGRRQASRMQSQSRGGWLYLGVQLLWVRPANAGWVRRPVLWMQSQSHGGWVGRL